MKSGNHAVQFEPHTRSATLDDLSAGGLEQRFNQQPSERSGHRLREDEVEGISMLVIRGIRL